MDSTHIQRIVRLPDFNFFVCEADHYPKNYSGDFDVPDEPAFVENIRAYVYMLDNSRWDIFDYLSEYWQDFIEAALLDTGKELRERLAKYEDKQL